MNETVSVQSCVELFGVSRYKIVGFS